MTDVFLKNRWAALALAVLVGCAEEENFEYPYNKRLFWAVSKEARGLFY